MPITLKDVAERAGVSRSAVSRTFTPGASVSLKTRKKVEKAARELGYSPSLIARGLATNRTKLIGLMANNFQNPAFLEVFDLYSRTLQEHGLRPLLVNLTDETDTAYSIEMLRQYQVDGVIIATSTLPPSFLFAFKDAQIPLVHAFGRVDPKSDVHIVGIDNQNAGKMAAETLLEHGYSSIAFLGGPEAATSTQDRATGFLNHLKKAGIEVEEICYASAYDYDAGRTAMKTLLKNTRIKAVFCGDDLICMGAMDEVRSSGLKIPEDIGFLGFNDMNIASWSSYNLTTVHQPVQDIILSSVELVISLVEKPDRALESRLFPCSIIERGTLKQN